MKKFLSIFKNKIKLFYGSWDRMVIKRTEIYNAWVRSYASNHKIPIITVQKNVLKEDFVLPFYQRFKKEEGVVYILKIYGTESHLLFLHAPIHNKRSQL